MCVRGASAAPHNQLQESMRAGACAARVQLRCPPPPPTLRPFVAYELSARVELRVALCSVPLADLAAAAHLMIDGYSDAKSRVTTGEK